MKARSIKYLTGEGIKNVWVNRLMSIASVGVLMACMVLIGIAVIIGQNVNRAMVGLEKQNVVMVYFNDYNSVMYPIDFDADDEMIDPSTITDDMYVVHNDEEGKAVAEKIEKLDNIAEVEYFTKEEDMQRFEDKKISNITDDVNFCSCGAKVTLKDLSRFDETIEGIEKVEGVYHISSSDETAEIISAIKDGLGTAGIWIIAILLIISLVIVCNTIRVTMYNRKLEISIMKAVGATDAFVRLPFVVEGILLGLISAILSEVVVYFCYRVMLETFIPSIMGATMPVSFASAALPIFGLFVAIGVVSGVIGSVIMISKYLRREGSEFKAYN
ncbi:MAG: permease-like cell division protein FtsX [Clostridia bacterium]|nr:permease-like cell division protein FtsX [Clostridia bacterium]